MKNILFYIFYAKAYILSLLPMRILYLFSDITYFIVFYLIKYRKKVVYKNLRNAFPEKDKQEIARIARKFYRFFCDFLFENIKSITISKKEMLKRMSFKNPEVFENHYNSGKNVIFVSGHYANWEWTTIYPSIMKHKVLVTYHPLHNKKIDNLMNEIRSRYGANLVTMKNTYITVLRHHRSKELTATWLISDQRPRKHNKVFWTRFLNQDTAFFLGAERLAKKTSAAFVYLKIDRIKRGYYETELIPLYDDASTTEEFEVTKKHVEILEEIIRKKPELWLWSHNRWKYKRPADAVIH